MYATTWALWTPRAMGRGTIKLPTIYYHMGTVSTKGSGLLATKDSGITVVKGWQQTTMAMQIGMGLVVVVGVPYRRDGLVGLV